MFLTKSKLGTAAVLCACLIGGSFTSLGIAQDKNPKPVLGRLLDLDGDGRPDTIDGNLLALDKQLWEAAKTGDWKVYDRLVADDWVGYSARYGRSDKAATIANVKKRRYSDVTIRDVETKEVSKDVVILAYVYSCKATSAVDGTVEEYRDHQTSAVWARRDGAWVLVFCQDAASSKASPPFSRPNAPPAGDDKSSRDDPFNNAEKKTKPDLGDNIDPKGKVAGPLFDNVTGKQVGAGSDVKPGASDAPEDTLAKVKPKSYDGDPTDYLWSVMGLKVERAAESEVTGVYKGLRGGVTVIDIRRQGPSAAVLQRGDILVGLDVWETLDAQACAYVLLNCHKQGSKSVKYHVVRNAKLLTGSTALHFPPSRGPNIELSPKIEPAKGTKVGRLLEERLVILKELDDATEKAFRADKATFAELVEAKALVLRAELELCEGDQERLKMHEKIVAFAREFEQRALQLHRKGLLARTAVILATSKRLEAEIALERAMNGPSNRTFPASEGGGAGTRPTLVIPAEESALPHRVGAPGGGLKPGFDSGKPSGGAVPPALPAGGAIKTGDVSYTLPFDLPSREEILRALSVRDRPKNARIQCELLAFQLNTPRFYPLVGPARLAQAHFKCTASADGKSDVVHIDRDHLIAER